MQRFPSGTPEIELATGFVLDEGGRIVSTREPNSTHGPRFTIIRSPTQCAWAVHADLPEALAEEVTALARVEPPVRDLRAAPLHADRYLALLGGQVGFWGPAYNFPEVLPPAGGIVQLEDEGWLQRHFRGWGEGEIRAGRGPLFAVVEEGYPVSVCFCARRSDFAAAAGLETAEAYRGRGYGSRVTAAWATAIRATGRIPLYSTAWTNGPSQAVARKLGLTAYASFWSVTG